MEHLKNDLNLVHLGLRPENILVDPNGNIRIIEFCDCVSCYSFSKPFTVPKDSEFVSNISFVPTEYVNNHQFTMKSEMWNLGILLYYMVVGKMPFTGYNNAAIAREIATKDPVFPFNVSPELSDFIQYILYEEYRELWEDNINLNCCCKKTKKEEEEYGHVSVYIIY